MIQAIALLTLLATPDGSRCLPPEPLDLAPMTEFIEKRAFIYKTKLDPADSHLIAENATNVGLNFNLDPLFILALIEVESKYDKKAKSSKKCRGLTQLSKNTGKFLIAKFKLSNADYHNIAHSIFLGIAYLNQLIQQHKNVMVALTIYNKGYGNYQKDPRVSGYARWVASKHRLFKRIFDKEPLTCYK